MADEPESELELELDSPELFLGDGEAWFADLPALLKEFPDVIGFANDEGSTVAFVRGRGAVKMGDLLSKGRSAPKSSPKVSAIRADTTPPKE